MRTALLSLCLVLVAGCCSSSMRGVVSSSETGEPIQGAMIQVQNQTIGTDPMGFYRLQNLECRDFYEVAVTAPEYRMRRTTVTATSGEEEILANFKLEPIQRPEGQAMRGAQQERRPVAERRPVVLEEEEEFEVYEAGTGER